MKQVNVLVFPCGSEVGLEINRALKDVSFIKLFGASSVADHGKYVYEEYIEGIPFVTDKAFIFKINELIVDNQIDYIYPAMDQVIEVLALHRHDLKAELIAPCNDSVFTCRSKARTYARLSGLDFMPQIYESADNVDQFPVLIKPALGYGAKGVKVIDNIENLREELDKAEEETVICEYLSGEEYTIDCFTDRYGILQYCSCRNRKRIRNGISVNSQLQAFDKRIEEIAHTISKHITMRGAWFFQLKCNGNGEYKLLEVATRIAGTMCVNRACGVNLPLLTIFDMMGYDVEITKQINFVEVDRALYNAFNINTSFDEVYLDFDDTLIVHGKINTNLIRFLYQCVNKKIPIYLVTKHNSDIFLALKKYRIAEELFNEIIHIDSNKRKCDFIKPSTNALFIDDSFAERKQMQERYGIYTLGVDAVECLIDWRQ